MLLGANLSLCDSNQMASTEPGAIHGLVVVQQSHVTGTTQFDSDREPGHDRQTALDPVR
jgi:hypothetical protein